MRLFKFLFHPVMLCFWALSAGTVIMYDSLLVRRQILAYIELTRQQKSAKPDRFTVFPAVSDKFPGNVPAVEKIADVYNEPAQRFWISKRVYQKAERHFNRAGGSLISRMTNSTASGSIKLDRPIYRRNHLIRVSLTGVKSEVDWYAVLLKDGKRVTGAGGDFVFPFTDRNGRLTAVLNTGFAVMPGNYRIVAVAAVPGKLRVLFKQFLLQPRKLQRRKLPKAVVTLETAIPLKNQRLPGPDGKQGGYTGFFEWLKFMGGDAFWILGAHSDGIDAALSPANPLGVVPDQNVTLLAAEAKKRGIQFGAYAVSYFTPRKGGIKAGYAPSMGYKPDLDRFYVSRHTSLGSARRFYDLARFAARMQKRDGVGYIGFDFIRTGHRDGFELVDRFVADMNLRVPGNWGRLNKKQRMRWFARQVLSARNQIIIDKWRWWRAHFVSSLIGDVIKTGGVSKPVWVFTLGWEHGKQHGQDPYMMLDAGCTYVCAMLYEANELQFDGMEQQWHRYLRAADSRVLMGNCVDRHLNRSGVYSSLESFYRRMLRGYFNFVSGGNAGGMFWHDIGRAIWGRTGVFSAREWAVAGGAAFTAMRNSTGEEPLQVVSIQPALSKDGRRLAVRLTVTNRSGKTERAVCRVVNKRISTAVPAGRQLRVGPFATERFTVTIPVDRPLGGEYLLGVSLQRRLRPVAWFSRFIRFADRRNINNGSNGDSGSQGSSAVSSTDSASQGSSAVSSTDSASQGLSADSSSDDNGPADLDNSVSRSRSSSSESIKQSKTVSSADGSPLTLKSAGSESPVVSQQSTKSSGDID